MKKIIMAVGLIVSLCASSSYKNKVYLTSNYTIDSTVKHDDCGCDEAEKFPPYEYSVIESKDGSIMLPKTVDGYYIDDEILTSYQLNVILNKYTTLEQGGIPGRHPVVVPWTNGIITYTFADDMPDVVRNRIEEAIKRWEKQTKLRYIRIDEDNRLNYNNYAVFRYTGTGKCASQVGMNVKNDSANITSVYISSWCNVGKITHELGHLIGLFHEHQRPGREKYLEVNYDNIQPNMRQFFEVIESAIRDSIDFNSIMMYSSYNSFAIDKKRPTMTTLDGKTWDKQRDSLTHTDIWQVKKIYPFLYQ